MKIFGVQIGKNRKHEYVGRRFYSPYFKRYFTVTAYNDDKRWWLQLENYGREVEAETPLFYFIAKGLERPLEIKEIEMEK